MHRLYDASNGKEANTYSGIQCFIQGTVILGSGLRPNWSLGVSKVTGFLGAGRVAKIGLVPRLIV